jgi:hypothetical protein
MVTTVFSDVCENVTLTGEDSIRCAPAPPARVAPLRYCPVACGVYGGRRLHRSRCPVLILKCRVVAAVLAVVGSIGLVLHVVAGFDVNIFLTTTVLLIGAGATVGLAFVHQRK